MPLVGSDLGDAIKAGVDTYTAGLVGPYTPANEASRRVDLMRAVGEAIISYCVGVESALGGLDTALAAKAPLASPALTGVPTAPTASPGTNTTQLATTAYVVAAIAALIAAAPGALDTLNELAAALGNDANFAATVTSALAGKAAAVHTHAEADVTGLTTDLNIRPTRGQDVAAAMGWNLR